MHGPRVRRSFNPYTVQEAMGDALTPISPTMDSNEIAKEDGSKKIAGALTHSPRSVLDPNVRPTAAAALAHPWLAGIKYS